MIASFCLLALAGPAAADITGGAVTGGTASLPVNGGIFKNLTSTLPSAVGNNNINTWDLNAFDEVQNYTLASALVTDTGTIAAGTVIDSEYVIFDPPGNGGSLIGYVKFSGAILGMFNTEAGLTASNGLGDAPTVTYHDPADVGLELPGDSVTIDLINPNQIDWSTSASNPGDSVRVITAGVPEPGTVLLFGMFASVLLLFRRRVNSSR